MTSSALSTVTDQERRMNPIACMILVGFALVAAASPFEAQQTNQPKRVGVVLLGPTSTNGPFLAELREGLRDLGWIEGDNVVIESRYGEGNLDRLAEIATELVRLPVDVLVTGTVPATLVLKRATHTIPIVTQATDPAGTGLVTPGGNVAAFDGIPADAAGRQ